MSLDLKFWQAARYKALIADDGWLNLTDRVGLAMGLQTVGRGSGNNVVLRSGPDHLGALTLTDQGAQLRLPDGSVLIFTAEPDALAQLRVAGLLLELHCDAGQTALRVRDLTLPRQVQLTYFPANPKWIIDAEWVTLPMPESQIIAQKGGASVSIAATHVARFHYENQDVDLLATHWKAGKPMFVIRDATAGFQTYGAARFLIGDPSADGHVILDFNRAFSPPCAFTDFAICPLPPHSNILPFAVLAGEMWP